MTKKHHGGPAPIPSGNRPQQGPPTDDAVEDQTGTNTGSNFQDQDAKRRLGDFTGAGEHSRQQPGALNDGATHSQ